jgi:3-methyladenine DNA glycosylase/8-oxoguanine DNA glycosylase
MRVAGTLPLVGGGGEKVDLRRTLASHGVATLVPQRVDMETWQLQTTLVVGAVPCTIRIREGEPGQAKVETARPGMSPDADEKLLAAVRHLLRLDEDLSRFYRLAAADPALAWVTSGAGRMLRGPTVFEDVVKTICTTNCAWSATVRMVEAIVGHLGEAAPGGSHAFPAPEAMAAAGTDFYRDVARAGYRGAYLVQLAAGVADGSVDLQQLTDPDMPDAEVEKRLLALPGVGPYAAAHVMLIALSRYQRLILDSWTRPTYARLTGRKASDQVIERRFRRYGRYAGLAFWLYLTRGWIDD